MKLLTDSLKDDIIEGHLLVKISLDDGHANTLGWLDVAVHDVGFSAGSGLTALLLVKVERNAHLRNLGRGPTLIIITRDIRKFKLTKQSCHHSKAMAP